MLTDVLDNRSLGLCTFYPSGEFKEQSLTYLLDDDIGLAHLNPKYLGNQLDPIGVSIMVDSRDSDGNKYLLVDEVCGGFALGRIKPSVWVPMVHEGHIKIAQNLNAKGIIYNVSVMEETAKMVNRFLEKKYDKQLTSMYLSKAHGRKALDRFYNNSQEDGKNDYIYVEAFRNNRAGFPLEGNVSGLIFPINEN
jgi:hypothetical protein|tara:strand:+ start:626 stop:1204 length:579 start_codon:yes stop_codon:yes gene_type:complete